MSDHDQTPESVEYDDTGAEDFDAFWQEHDAKRKPRTIKVAGEVIELPRALPLAFQLETKRAERSEDIGDVRKLIGLLFGSDRLDHWIESGMDDEQFQVLLAYTPAKVQGSDITMAEAAEFVARKRAEEMAKANERRRGGDVSDPHRRRKNKRKRTGGSSSAAGGR